MTWIVLFFAAATDAAAQYSLPIGEREAFMGNVGIAREGTVGNTYFNPGALGFNKVNKLVGSGTLISVSNQETASGSVKMKTTQTQTLPIAAGTTWAKENWSWAFSAYNVNNDSALSSFSTTISGVGEVSGRARLDQFGILVGPSFATRFNSNIGVGFSAFYYQQDNSTIVSVPFQETVGANTAIGSIYTDSKTIARSLKLVAGILAKFEYVDLGFRFESGAFAAQAERESRNATVFYIKNGTNILSEVTSIGEPQKEKIKFERPHIVGGGIGGRLGQRTRIFSDVSYSLPIKYKPSADEDDEEFEGSMRAGLGLEYTGSGLKWLTGASLIEDFSGEEKYLYISGGLVSLDRRSDTALGAFYLGTLNAVESKNTTVGLLFSSTIKL